MAVNSTECAVVLLLEFLRSLNHAHAVSFLQCCASETCACCASAAKWLGIGSRATLLRSMKTPCSCMVPAFFMVAFGHILSPRNPAKVDSQGSSATKAPARISQTLTTACVPGPNQGAAGLCKEHSYNVYFLVPSRNAQKLTTQPAGVCYRHLATQKAVSCRVSHHGLKLVLYTLQSTLHIELQEQSLHRV